jgi:hypothetical protein
METQRIPLPNSQTIQAQLEGECKGLVGSGVGFLGANPIVRGDCGIYPKKQRMISE